jgi:thiamine-phosphate pyrophosphorylase
MVNGPSNTALRLIDANANRALEGLRVCEEIARFHLESPAGFRRIRGLRHEVAQAISALPVDVAARLRARASRRDLGRRSPASQVESLERLLLINFQRAKEALRTLEECARFIAPRHAGSFQRLRFHTYEVERALLLATVRDH